ncbi:hypothetical protein KC678_05370, partial [Candidatus Dojkabacteria bacterium]|nr:hypothetical protein [Candidatus Dojkabacteria bacterium]
MRDLPIVKNGEYKGLPSQLIVRSASSDELSLDQIKTEFNFIPEDCIYLRGKGIKDSDELLEQLSSFQTEFESSNE